MADDSASFGGDTPDFGSGLTFGGGPSVGAPTSLAPPSAAMANAQAPDSGPSFGQKLGRLLGAPDYHAPDPEMTALDQSADMLQQRIKRANEVATNPLLQFFNPEGVQAARNFAPQAAEKLQQIRQQQATIAAGKQQAATLGLEPGALPDEASTADRVEVAKARALKGDMRAFQGLQAVDPKSAEAIQDQVHEVVAGHLTKAQYAYDSLAGMQNQGQYVAKLDQLRKEGALSDLEALGMKVPGSFNDFQNSKALEGKALRDARVGIDAIRTKLEERNTYQPMEEKEAKTYNGRMTTIYGDQITNGTWSRNAASGARGLVVNGAGDPRDLGKNFALASPEQRKEISEAAKTAVPKEDLEKYRAFNRTYELATKGAKGNDVAAGKINTNPNVQQGIAEGLASMLRGGSGGANVGLLKIELAKRGWAQGAIDGLISNYNGALNTLFANADKPYLSAKTQQQIRDVMDVLKTYNDKAVGERIGNLAERAGALGLDRTVFGLEKGETKGAIDDAIERGRLGQIARMLPNHQAIGSGDGVFQLGAQRPGAGAVPLPPGADPSTQTPGGDRVATPVQQQAQPTGTPTPGTGPSGPQVPGASPPTAAPPAQPTGAPAPVAPGAPASGAQPAPVTIAGQQVSVPTPPGASPAFVTATQRIESGREKDPWTATTGRGPDGKPMSSASGAFMLTDGTWNENKPAGAPAHAKDATPAQQAEAFATLTAKNASALQKAGMPVNDTSLYVAHNIGATGAQKLLSADPNADARSVVGEAAARNNPLFFRGRPTVAKVLERYDTEMTKGLQPTPEGVKPLPGGDGDKPGFMSRVRNTLDKYFMQGVSGTQEDKHAASQAIIDAGVEHAPAIGSTLGAVGGTVAGGPVGGIAGGAAGGAGGQALKDYIQGNGQSATRIAKEGALGAVLGVASEARPVAAAAARVVGGGTVSGGSAALEGKDGADVVDEGLKGGALAAGGEAFGRALGMIGHKVFSMFSSGAKTAVRDAAKAYSEAQEVLSSEAPKIPGANGAAATVNPKYEAAEAAKTKAEQTLKDAGLNPEEAAYAHKVSTTDDGNIPHKRQEAEVGRPGAIEQQRIGAGYQQLENEVADKGRGAVKPTPKLADGPIATAENAKMSDTLKGAAERTEMAITAPAANWQEKWVQLQQARSALLTLERDALTSTSAGRTQLAADYRTLADSVRAQQEKAAKYVFGEKDGEAFMQRLKVLDVRYRNLMEATNGGDLMKAAKLTGEAGRDAERKFVAFAHDDPQAVAAYRAIRGVKGDVAEATVPWTVAAEGIPGVGKVVKVAKMATLLKEWARERAAGSPVKFSDLVNQNAGDAEVGRSMRDVLGTAGARGAAM